MLSNQTFNIYRKPQFDETIQRVEERTYHPFVKSFNNNDVLEISIHQGDSWLMMCNAEICITGELKKTGGDGIVTFINNAGAFLFDQISYEVNGKELDCVRSPGIISTIRGYLCYDENDSRHLDIAGWNYPSVAIRHPTDGSFDMRIPLKHLLGIFNDYNLAMCGKQTIRLVRARSDNDCMLIEEPAGASTATTAKLSINDIVLKVTHVYPNDDIKLDLLQAIKSDRPIVVPYRKWELHELPALTPGSTHEIWAVKTSSQTDSPRFVITVFQTGRRDKTSEDPTLFDNIDAADVRLNLNGEYYPKERMRLDFKKISYAAAHHSYSEFYPSFMRTMEKKTLLNYMAFKNRALFVTDCSRRSENIKSSTIDVKLDIEVNTGIPPNTRAYCVIIHDCVMEHLPLSEIVRNLS